MIDRGLQSAINGSAAQAESGFCFPPLFIQMNFRIVLHLIEAEIASEHFNIWLICEYLPGKFIIVVHAGDADDK